MIVFRVFSILASYSMLLGGFLATLVRPRFLYVVVFRFTKVDEICTRSLPLALLAFILVFFAT